MNFITAVEDHVRTTMGQIRSSELSLAHDYAHVDRVRHWAVQIAQHESYVHRELVEVTALLHDIGLAFVTDRAQHAAVGADQAAAYLHQHSAYTSHTIALAADAIRAHSSVSGGGELGAILRDADILDLLGPVGILRACVSKYAKPAYTDVAVKGETWGFTGAQFTQRFITKQGIGPTIMDQLNFQVSCAENLSTSSAKQFAAPLVAYIRAYLLAFEAQVSSNSTA